MEKKTFKLGNECYEFFGNYSGESTQAMLNNFPEMTEEQKNEYLSAAKVQSLKVGKDLVEFIIGNKQLPITVETKGYEITIEA